MSKLIRRSRYRRASIVALSAFMMVVMLGMVAFSIDVGYMLLVRTQLQTAADSAAMAACASMSGTAADVTAAAQQFAGYHVAGGKTVSLGSSDVEFGTWDAATKTFTPSAALGNAVRVTAKRNNSTGGNNLFFGKVFGKNSFEQQASAIAMGNPRDICFVVDLSGSMNDDTEPCWATAALTAQLTPDGYGSVASELMQQLYTDLGYGTFPGTLQWVGSTAGVTADNRAYANLTKNGGPLTLTGVSSTYKINSGDSESTRKTKGYKWIIDNQLAVIMPDAKPTPNSSTNYNYWEKYLDYIIENVTVNSGSGASPTNRGALPPNQDSDRITSYNNPNTTSYPSAGTTERNSYRNQLGYRTYVQFMHDAGRNNQPDGSNYTHMAVSSPNCAYHSEATAGGTFNFPPSEQPTHASRRSLIAAMQEIKARNNTIPDMNQRDWVSIVTFDTVSGTLVAHSLSGSYDSAMLACTTLQAVGDNQSSTATETGLLAAKNHIKPSSQGGSGRINTQKVVVLLTDGMPNLKSSSDSTVSSYRSANPDSDFYGGGSYTSDAALMQSMAMQLQNWKVFSVGLGLGTNYDFMDRLARMGGTSNSDGESPRTSGNPVAYEAELSKIFKNIITNPQVRLVQ